MTWFTTYLLVELQTLSWPQLTQTRVIVSHICCWFEIVVGDNQQSWRHFNSNVSASVAIFLHHDQLM